MGFWTDAVIPVPRATFNRLQMLVEEVYLMEEGEELDNRSRKDLAEKLAVNVLNEYIHEHFEESTKAAAQMFRSRRRQRDFMV